MPDIFAKAALLITAISFLVFSGCVEYGPPGNAKVIPQAITFLISSNTNSNYTPCGCASGKWGGMPRRGSIQTSLDEKIEWPMLVVDTGDVSQGSTGDLPLKKDTFIFNAYQVMRYDAVNVGLSDLRLGYDQLAAFQTDFGIPFISANTFSPNTYPDLPIITPGNTVSPGINPTDSSQTGQPAPIAPPQPLVEPLVPDAAPLFAPYVIVEPENASGYKVGIIGMMIQDAGRLNPMRDTYSFEPYAQSIRNTVDKLRNAEKADLIVLLSDADSLDNVDKPVVFEGIDLVIGGMTNIERSPNAFNNPLNPLYNPDVDQAIHPPPAENGEIPEIVLEPIPTPIIVPKAAGRGRLVKRFDITLNSSGQIIDYYSEDISVSEEYPDDPRMADISQGYDRDILAAELNDRILREYSGSQACEQCHPGFLAAWADNGHFRSYETIMQSENPQDRECTRCHAVGFVEEPRLLTYDLIDPKIQQVGCEGCHPQGQRHISLQTHLMSLSPEARANIINPDAMSTEITPESCALCHTGEFAEGFVFADSLEEARQICMSIQPSTVIRLPAETDTPPAMSQAE